MNQGTSIQVRKTRDQEPGTKSPRVQEPGNQEPRVHETGNNFRNQEPGTRDQRPNQEYKSSGVQEIGTRNPGTWDQEPGTRSPGVHEPGIQEPVARNPGIWPQIWIWLGKNFSDLSVQLSRLKGQIGHNRRNRDRPLWHCKDKCDAFGTWCTVTSSAQVKFFLPSAPQLSNSSN